MIVITGAGPIGTHIARQYVDAGTAVRILTRSGSGIEHPLAERRQVDVNDRAALLEACRDANVVHYCIHASAYVTQAWRRELPAAERVMLDIAEQVDATVVFPESLYAFDLSVQPITESTPLRPMTSKGEVRTELLTARASSSARTISVVASDYFGPGAGANAIAGDRMVAPATTGKTARTIGSIEQPHSWTYLPDLAAAMIRAAALPPQPNRLLFAPTNPARTQREVAEAFARSADRDDASVKPLPGWLLRLIGRFNATMHGMVEMSLLFERPLVMDSSVSEAELQQHPTPWDLAVRTTTTNHEI